MPDNTALGAHDDMQASIDRAVAAAVAEIAAMTPEAQQAALQADLASILPGLRRLRLRAMAMAITNPGKPTLAHWAASGLAMPDLMAQMAALAVAAPALPPRG